MRAKSAARVSSSSMRWSDWVERSRSQFSVSVGVAPGLAQDRDRLRLEKAGRLDLGDDPVVGPDAVGLVGSPLLGQKVAVSGVQVPFELRAAPLGDDVPDGGERSVRSQSLPCAFTQRAAGRPSARTGRRGRDRKRAGWVASPRRLSPRPWRWGSAASLCRATAPSGHWARGTSSEIPRDAKATLALPVPAPTSATGIVTSWSSQAKARTESISCDG